MTTPAQWLEGARPRTLPAAVAPVLVGSGAAGAVDGSRPAGRCWRWSSRWPCRSPSTTPTTTATGYAAPTATAGSAVPDRFAWSAAASPPPAAVKAAAVGAFAVAALAGLVLALLTTLWLVLLGAVMIAAAWLYTGGTNPYGYRGLGEVSVFVFFGLVAVLGTTYVQVGAADLGGAAAAGSPAARWPARSS